MQNETSSSQFQACIEYYLNVLIINDYSVNTITLKREHLTAFATWLNGQCIDDFADVTLDVFEQYMGYLRFKKSENHPDKYLSVSTVRCRLTSVRVFLRFLTKRSFILHREVEKYELPSVGLVLPKPILSYRDVLRVIKQIPINTIKGLRDRAMLECFYATGMRRGELVNLDIADVDFSQSQLRIIHGKGKKDRYVPFGNMANIWLIKYLSEARPVLARTHTVNAFFLDSNGQRCKPPQLSSLMSKYIKKANINKTGACHQYRHAAATHMLDNDADIRHVQELLGHASISTTQLYLHVSKAKLRAVYAKTHPRA
ncbi:tyrosine-type recombinase/integrase [Glaciecola siphonariae]|uniref:Tyrosine-type recombinase/integrase n=1 Tax=Glaciecola siphonariae TaxID=521012 RepID=A0ABV9LSM2_9ALTE